MKTTRRKFLQQSAVWVAGSAGVAAAGAGFAGCAIPREAKPRRQIMTVRGPIPSEELGPTLPHEHIFLDFIGAEQVSKDRYDADVIFNAVLPQLQLLKDCGGQSLAECTPAYIGRDAALLKRLAEATDLHLLTNTGYYGAGKNKYLPKHAYQESAAELAGRWLTEWRDGIEGTEVFPGFIKIGVDGGKLSDLHRTLVRAAARTHMASGLTIAAHTGNGAAALDELAVLREEGVAGHAFIWVHAQSERDGDIHFQAAERGAWVEFDNVSSKDLGRHVALVLGMKERGFLHQVLVSHDAGWYEVGKPNGGTFRPYDTLFKEFLPALKEAGLTAAEIEQLLVINPREAFTIRVRPA